MPTHRETRQQGKQYNHEQFMHGGKGSMKKSGISHHMSGESGYKHPHDRDFSDGANSGSAEYLKE